MAIFSVAVGCLLGVEPFIADFTFNHPVVDVARIDVPQEVRLVVAIIVAIALRALDLLRLAKFKSLVMGYHCMVSFLGLNVFLGREGKEASIS